MSLHPYDLPETHTNARRLPSVRGLAVQAATLAMLLVGSRTVVAQIPHGSTFTLPAPSGPFAVGTTEWQLTDRGRVETVAAGDRVIGVVAWYPAASGSGTAGNRARYLRESVAEVQAFGALIGKPGAYDALAGVATHAIHNAPPLLTRERLPVLLFSHGYTGVASA